MNWSNYVKYLGDIIECRLNFNQNVNNITKTTTQPVVCFTLN